MKTILIILTQANITQLQTNESLSVAMVLATFGSNITIVFKDAALSILQDELHFNKQEHAFKFGSNMRESFEFYDIDPIYVQEKDKHDPFVQQTSQNVEYIELTSEFLKKFNHVLYW